MRTLILLLCPLLTGCYYGPYPYYSYGYPVYRYPAYAPAYAPGYPPVTYMPAPYPYEGPSYAPAAPPGALDPNNCGTPDAPKACGTARHAHAAASASYPAPVHY